MKKLFSVLMVFAFLIETTSCSFSGVPIDAEHFPDSAFRAELSKYDANENGVLSKSEMEKFDSLHLSGVSVKNSSSLEKLRISTCWGGELEVSQCTNLTYVDVQYGAKTEYCTMKISGCDKLDRLYVVDNNNLSELSLSDCNLLSYALISSHSGSLSGFTVSGCPNLNDLWIMGSAIQEIDITGCPFLISASKQNPNEDIGRCVNYKSDDGFICCDEQIKFVYS